MMMLMMAGIQGVGAQEAAEPKDAKNEQKLYGQVLDAKTGTPLIGAFVRVDGDEWGSLSEANGSFELKRVEVGTVPLVVEQLGYLTLRQDVAVREPGEAMVLRVEPDPALLEGVNLVLDRLEQRRNATPFSSWVFDRADLVTNVGADALGFLEARTPIHLFPCFFGSECAIVHGRVRPVSVVVDEMPFLGGIDYLRSHEPYDLQRIEVYAGGRHIRIFTAGFLQRAGKTRLLPSPFIL
jgi:hypothetical protein